MDHFVRALRATHRRIRSCRSIRNVVYDFLTQDFPCYPAEMTEIMQSLMEISLDRIACGEDPGEVDLELGAIALTFLAWHDATEQPEQCDGLTNSQDLVVKRLIEGVEATDT